MKKKYSFWQKFRNIPKIDNLNFKIEQYQLASLANDNYNNINREKINDLKNENEKLKNNKSSNITQIHNLENRNKQLKNDIASNIEKINNLENKNKELENQLIKHNAKSVEKFKKEVFDKLETYTQKYNYDGKGEKPIQMCLGISEAGKTYFKKKLINPFVRKNKKNYMLHNIDDLVLDFMLYIYRKRWKYKSDKKNFGVNEMFSKPLDSLKLLENDGADCDDFAIVSYNALKLLLIEFGFDSELWRLQCMIVDVITGGRHFNLAWLKSNISDWVFIETTYFKSTTIKSFQNNIGLKQNLLYDRIVYSFDENSCRRKLE